MNYCEKERSGCGVAGVMNRGGRRFSGEVIMGAAACMRERSNGLGGGFAGYGIYPTLPEHYALHLMYENNSAKAEVETHLRENFLIEKDEAMPTREIGHLQGRPSLWRYFVSPKTASKDWDSDLGEEDFVVKFVMFVNARIQGAFVASSGKNMGIFKGVGYPEDIGRFFRLEEYEGYIWTSHGRFPTNTAAWWGGAHPFGLLDWSVVHNGEISSYGINKRYLENFGYNCTLFTDTEVLAYLIDLLARKHRFPFELVSTILAPPLWEEIEKMPKEKKELFEAFRLAYGSALVNGPFALIAANRGSMFGLNDRVKLRPLVAATREEFLYIASEESAIRQICPAPDRLWMPEAGELTIGRLWR